MAVPLLLFVLAASASATTCEDLGYACSATSVELPSDRTLCIGDCTNIPSSTDHVNLIVAPGNKIKFSDTLYAETDATTGDTWWYTDNGTAQVRQMTVHGNALYVGSSAPLVGSPTEGVFVTGEKVSGTTADGVWARESRIQISSPVDGRVVGYQDYVYLAGSQSKRGFLFELEDKPDSRLVLTGNQVIMGQAPLNLILQNEDASVVATGDIVVERAEYPKSHVSCVDIPVTGKQDILIMNQYIPPSTCYHNIAIRTRSWKLEIVKTACYAFADYPVLRNITSANANGFFRLSDGCPDLTDPAPNMLQVRTYQTEAECNTNNPIPTPTSYQLGSCVDTTYMYCRDETI